MVSTMKYESSFNPSFLHELVGFAVEEENFVAHVVTQSRDTHVIGLVR